MSFSPIQTLSKIPTTAAGTALAVAMLFACGESTTLSSASPHRLGSALAYFERSTASVIIVDPNGEAGPSKNFAARIVLDGSPISAQAAPVPNAPDETQLLLVDPDKQAVHIIRNARGDRETLPAGVPLEKLDVSADGRWGIVYQADGSEPTQSLFAFPNTVSVMDLRPGHAKATTLRLGQSGARPIKAVFPKALRLSDRAYDGQTLTESADIALVFVPQGIVPIDLTRSIAGALIPLSSRDSGSSNGTLANPEEVLFTNNRGDDRRGTLDGLERAFVRTAGGELFTLVISFSPERFAGDAQAMSVSVAVENVVTPDAQIHDIELFFTPDGDALLLAAAGDELVLVNGFTGVASRFPQATYANRLARFSDPEDGRALAIAYGTHPSVADAVALRVDPLGLDRRRSTGTETIRLAAPVERIQVANGAGRAILHYEDSRSLGILDLVRGGAVLDMRFAADPSAHALSNSGDRFWVAGYSPQDASTHLAEVQIGGLTGTASEAGVASTDVRLDRDAQSIGRVGDYLWVDHGTTTGAVTFMPVSDLSRQTAVTFDGLLLTEIFKVDASGNAPSSNTHRSYP